MRIHELLDEGIEKQFPLPYKSDDLAMDKSSRYERAKSMGFDTSTMYYHGTKHDFSKFDPYKSNSSSNTGVPLNTIVLTTNPAVSDTYAGQEISSYGDNERYTSGSNVIPLFLRKGKTMIVDAKGRNWNDLYFSKNPEVETTNDLAIIAQQKNKDILIIQNVIDIATYRTKEQRDSYAGTTIFVFNPSFVRSINAKFDPANADSENLMD
jgi:hypothetical protein